MVLRDRGRLTVNDLIETIFPGFPYQGVSISMLMNHTSGMPDEGWAIQFLQDTSRLIDNHTLLYLVMTMPPEPLFAPGERWSYCNIAYELLASVIEKVAGRDSEEFDSSELLGPAVRKSGVLHRFSGLPKPEHATHSYVI